MRVRVKSRLTTPPLRCWWHIADNDEDATINDVVGGICGALLPSFASDSVALELDGYVLPGSARAIELVREGDVLNIMRTTSIPETVTNPDLAVAVVREKASQLTQVMKRQVERIQETMQLLERRLTAAEARTYEAGQALQNMRDSSASSDSCDSDSSEDSRDSDSSADSSDSSESSSESDTNAVQNLPVLQPNPAVQEHPAMEPKAQENATDRGIPFEGTGKTAKRNDRRRRARLLQSLVQAGELRKGSTFKDLDRWQVYNYGSATFGMPAVERSSGEVSEADEGPPSEYGVQQAPTQAIEAPPLSSTPVSQPPAPCLASPEAHWEQNVMVKRIECETEYTEETLPVMQYIEHQYVQSEPRGKKRKRQQEEHSSKHQRTIPISYEIASEEADYGADMYGEPTAIAAATTHGLDSAVAVSQLTDGDLPALPADLSILKKLQATSPEMIQIGRVVAFRQLVMQNYEPVESDFKTAKIVEVDGSDIKLQLAQRDIEPAQYDYDGNRILGKFEVEGEDYEIEEGFCWLGLNELIDPLLVC